jgi:hypothetical protein
MPFDLLPQHHIVLPKVQFYYPDARLAEMALKSREWAYNAMLQGVDKVVNAADPVTRAQRAQVLAEAQFQQQYGMPARIAQAQYQMQTGLPLQEAQAKATRAQLDYQMEQYRRMMAMQAAASGAGGAGGAGQAPASPATRAPDSRYQNAFPQPPEGQVDVAGNLTVGIPGATSIVPGAAPPTPVTPTIPLRPTDDEQQAAEQQNGQGSSTTGST